MRVHSWAREACVDCNGHTYDTCMDVCLATLQRLPLPQIPVHSVLATEVSQATVAAIRQRRVDQGTSARQGHSAR